LNSKNRELKVLNNTLERYNATLHSRKKQQNRGAKFFKPKQLE